MNPQISASPVLICEHTQCFPKVHATDATLFGLRTSPAGNISNNWFPSAELAAYVCRWDFKAKHFDAVLLFKMGKFYEMFEMDAHTGAEVLGLIYMKVSTPWYHSCPLSKPACRSGRLVKLSCSHCNEQDIERHVQGDQPHCGFPEANYHLHAERLARAGLKVVVVEQTETPDQLKIRNEQRRAAGKTKVSHLTASMQVVCSYGSVSHGSG